MQPRASQPLSRLHIWHEDQEHLQASLDRVFLLHASGAAASHGGATPENLRRYVENVEAFIALAPSPIGLLFQFAGAPRPPDEANRKPLMDLVDRHAARIAGLAVCMPASGFIAAALRSVVSAVFVFDRPKYPVKILGKPGDAQAWLADRMSIPVELVATLSDYGFERLGH